MSPRIIQIISLTLACLAFSGSAQADASILSGLGKTAFGITVERLDPEARQAGLSESGLYKVVEARLRKRKIPLNNITGPELYVRIVVLTSRAVNNEVLGYGAHVELSLRETALLKRDKTTEFRAPTWFKGNVTVANPKQFVPQTVRVLATLVDQFLNDYQSQNRK
jgi:hypothetical protein